jgi:hypothetical protein
MEGGFSGFTIAGRNKRNIPLPILKNEPMGRNNEYTKREE